MHSIIEPVHQLHKGVRGPDESSRAEREPGGEGGGQRGQVCPQPAGRDQPQTGRFES